MRVRGNCRGLAVARIEVGLDSVVVEGRLQKEACEEFEEALDSLRRSEVAWAMVDLSRVTAATAEPIGLLFAAWLDMFKQGRPPYLRVPNHIWRMLGKAAVDHGFSRKSAGSVRPGPSRPDDVVDQLD